MMMALDRSLRKVFAPPKKGIIGTGKVPLSSPRILMPLVSRLAAKERIMPKITRTRISGKSLKNLYLLEYFLQRKEASYYFAFVVRGRVSLPSQYTEHAQENKAKHAEAERGPRNNSKVFEEIRNFVISMNSLLRRRRKSEKRINLFPPQKQKNKNIEPNKKRKKKIKGPARRG
jgi:hypothetical protein